MNTITESNQAERLEEIAAEMRSRLTEVQEKVSRMETVPRRDIRHFLHRVETMVAALVRDSAEVKEKPGATLEKTKELASRVDKELTNLNLEVDTLRQGSPSVISAALDAFDRVVEGHGRKDS